MSWDVSSLRYLYQPHSFYPIEHRAASTMYIPFVILLVVLAAVGSWHLARRGYAPKRELGHRMDTD